MPPSGEAARAAAAKALTDPASFATTLLVLFVDTCGGEDGRSALPDWHPATVRSALEETFGVTLPEGNYAKLMAAIAVVTTDRFYTDLKSFGTLANALNGHAPIPGLFMAADDAAELAWAITEALLLAPPAADDTDPFAPEILRYLGHVLADEGILDPPDVLAIAARTGRGDLRRALALHADSPRTAAAIRALEEAKTREINNTIRRGLRNLIDQLGRLSLANGDARALLARLSSRDT